MRKTTVLILILATLLLSGCSYKIVKVEKDAENKNGNSEAAAEQKSKASTHDFDRYWAEIIQVGGTGVRNHQITAWTSLDGIYYFENPDTWISTFFNTPATIMYVSCKDGYAIETCKSDNKYWLDDVAGTCGVMIEDQLKNRVSVGCIIDLTD